jgi:DNA topoisomerase-1
MKLVIVESPNKIKKIKAILGSGWDVAASVGHIRDLPVKSLGTEPNTYQLEYQIIERSESVVVTTAAARCSLRPGLSRNGP